MIDTNATIRSCAEIKTIKKNMTNRIIVINSVNCLLWCLKYRTDDLKIIVVVKMTKILKKSIYALTATVLLSAK